MPASRDFSAAAGRRVESKRINPGPVIRVSRRLYFHEDFVYRYPGQACDRFQVPRDNV